MEFIESQQVKFPDLSQHYENLGKLFSKKLWHQLTVALEDFIRNKSNHRGENLYELYHEFISKFEIRLNQVNFSQMISAIGHSFPGTQRSLDLYLRILLSRNRLGAEASMCLDMEVVMAKLELGLIEDAKSLLKISKEKLSTISSFETIVFAKYYRATSEYRKIAGPPQEFYRSALMYLSYVECNELPLEEKYVLATDIALAALTGEEIYNFGEVISTPILCSLKETPNCWIYDLVIAINKGDIDSFNNIIDTYRSSFFSQPCLQASNELIKQKVVLLCVVNLAFEKSSHDRSIPFAEIAQRTRLPIDQVEWLLMRAMSLGLVKGYIDQVEEVLVVTWVQPRILDNSQLDHLSNQIDKWTEKVKGALVNVEDHSVELYF